LNNPFQSIPTDKSIGSHSPNWYKSHHFDKVGLHRSQGLYAIVKVKLLKECFTIKKKKRHSLEIREDFEIVSTYFHRRRQPIQAIICY